MDSFDNGIALRIDVDYPNLVPDAVDFMLDTLGVNGCKATFFLVVGDAMCGVSPVRFFSPSYIARLVKLRAWRFAGRLSAGNRGADGPVRKMISRITSEGHELAVHGMRHGWWIDNVWRADIGELEDEIAGAYELARQLGAPDGMAWGSPGWKTRDDVLQILAERKVTYLAECWGREPFYTVSNGKVINIIHLPITLPSFEASATVDDVVGRLKPGRYNMAVCHDYYEGFLRRDVFRDFLTGCSTRGLHTISLAEAAGVAMQSGCDLPECKVMKAKVKGFFGEVSVQE